MKIFYNLILTFLILLLFQLVCQPAYALGYIISFSGSGAASTVQSVEVQNLTKGTTVTVPSGSALKLYDGTTTAVESPLSAPNEIQLYPNPVVDCAHASFLVKEQGAATIRLISADGKLLLAKNYNLSVGKTDITLTVPAGIYALQVSGAGYTYTAKVVGTSLFVKPSIIINRTELIKSGVKQQPEISLVSMYFNPGDRLLYKGSSGNYRTVVVDIPSVNKTVNFNFVECKDADNNYYSVVQIGSLLWSVENLRTTKYRNGDVIPTVSLSEMSQWAALTTGAYSNYDVADWILLYGRWYNFYAVSDSRNIAPVGWHVATNAEWALLINNQKNAGALLKETGNAHWGTTDATYTTNEFGFTALPGGFRYPDGTYNQFTYTSDITWWWTSTEANSTQAFFRGLLNDSQGIYGNSPNSKNYGMGVRLVHD